MYMSNAIRLDSLAVTYTNDWVYIGNAPDIDAAQHPESGHRSGNAPCVQMNYRALDLEWLVKLYSRPVGEQTDEKYLAVEILASGVDAVYSRQGLLELCQAIIQLQPARRKGICH